MQICLFVWGFSSSYSRSFFYSNWDLTKRAVKDCKLCPWHSWPFCNKGSLACHTCRDMGHPFIMVILEDPWHLHLLQWSCPYLCLRLKSVAAGIRTLNLPHARRTNVLTGCDNAAPTVNLFIKWKRKFILKCKTPASLFEIYVIILWSNKGIYSVHKPV